MASRIEYAQIPGAGVEEPDIAGTRIEQSHILAARIETTEPSQIVPAEPDTDIPVAGIGQPDVADAHVRQAEIAAAGIAEPDVVEPDIAQSEVVAAQRAARQHPRQLSTYIADTRHQRAGVEIARNRSRQHLHGLGGLVKPARGVRADVPESRHPAGAGVKEARGRGGGRIPEPRRRRNVAAHDVDGPDAADGVQVQGMLSMVIAGVLRALMWPITLIASGSGCSGIENPGMVKASVPAVTPSQGERPPVGMLRPTGKRVRAGVE